MYANPIFKIYKQSESLQYFSDVATLCLKSNIETLAVPLQNLVVINDKLGNAFKHAKGSDLTELLTLNDQRRDDAVVCIRMTAQAYSNHFEPEKREAAANILDTIDKYGKSLHRLNYQAETSVLLNLYNDLTASPLADAVDEIHMSDVVEEMKESNDLFSEAFLNRVQESAADNQVAAGKLVQEGIKHYRTLMDYINAYNTINPSAEYDMLLKQIGELTAKYNSTATSRVSAKTEKIEL